MATSRSDVAIYRLATVADGAALAELRWLLKTDEGREAGAEGRAELAARYQAHLEREDATRYWVAADETGLIGVATLRLAAKEPAPQRPNDAIGYLTNVYVRPEFRNGGIGTGLLKRLIADARETETELLIVWPSERSRTMYHRLGFSGSSDPLELILRDDG